MRFALFFVVIIGNLLEKETLNYLLFSTNHYFLAYLVLNGVS